MATPASTDAAILTGNLLFSAGGVKADDLIGAFIKSVTAGGLVTFQNANGLESTVQLTVGGGGSGATVTSGTADPSGGSDGDAYIQVDGSSVVQSIWLNDSGTWTEYTIPAGGTGGGPDLSDADPSTVIGSGASPGTSADASRADHQHHLHDGAVTQVKISDLAVSESKLADDAVATAKVADGAITAAKLAAGVGGSGTVTTDAPVSGDGSAGDPVTIANQAIGHTKIGSSVGGVDQAAGRILEADGAGDVRWANKGGGGGGTGDALSSIDFPTPDSTNVYDIIDHLGQAYWNKPEVVGVAVTWSASVDGDDVSSLWGESNGTYIFRGIENTADVTSPQAGDVVLRPTGGFRHRGATRWAHLGNPIGWVGGPYADENEANNHVTATNDVSAFDNALQLVTAYTAGTTHYQWANIVEVPRPRPW